MDERSICVDFTYLKANLEKLGYLVSCFEGKEQAAGYLQRSIRGRTVGIGGSITVKEMGLYDRLSKENEVYWHWMPHTGSTEDEMRVRARDAEIYISSVNGIAQTGEIINIDGFGNRVAELLFGHKKVYLLVGQNKVEADYEKALFRARNIAAPMNAQRLQKKTPCALKADRCYNCNSPDRICRALTVFWQKPMNCAYEVVLIHEVLGY